MKATMTTAPALASDDQPIKLSTILARAAQVDHCINGAVLMLKQERLSGDCQSSGEQARKAASRLALTLATMRAEFELMHAELETLTGRLNHWVEDGVIEAQHGTINHYVS